MRLDFMNPAPDARITIPVGAERLHLDRERVADLAVKLCAGRPRASGISLELVLERIIRLQRLLAASHQQQLLSALLFTLCHFFAVSRALAGSLLEP